MAIIEILLKNYYNYGYIFYNSVKLKSYTYKKNVQSIVAKTTITIHSKKIKIRKINEIRTRRLFCSSIILSIRKRHIKLKIITPNKYSII